MRSLYVAGASAIGVEDGERGQLSSKMTALPVALDLLLFKSMHINIL